MGLLIALSIIQLAVLALLPINNVWLNLFFKKFGPLLLLGCSICGFLDELSVKLKLYDREKSDVMNSANRNIEPVSSISAIEVEIKQI